MLGPLKQIFGSVTVLDHHGMHKEGEDREGKGEGKGTGDGRKKKEKKRGERRGTLTMCVIPL